MPDQTSTVTGDAGCSAAQTGAATTNADVTGTGVTSAGAISTAAISTPATNDLFIGTITYDPSGTASRKAASTSVVPRVSYRAHRLADDERGAATAEYAIATMAAVGFAGLLVVIMRSDEIRGILTDLVRNALTFVG